MTNVVRSGTDLPPPQQPLSTIPRDSREIAHRYSN
jgi:hypothetical protein